MSLGPCTDWLTGDDVAACCSAETSDGTIFDAALEAAQDLLFELSGRQFAGECSEIVRPCRTRCGCGWQVLSRGHIVGWQGDRWYCDSSPCGCRPLSRVRLAGYVRSITEVKIDGAVVAPDTYRLDDHRWLTRVRDPADTDTVLLWPACQSLDLADTEPGTFSVSYKFGLDPPELGVQAAAQLACEVYKACAGDNCALPSGTVRVIRQGVTIEKSAFLQWAFQAVGSRAVPKGWHTGLPLVDAFLNGFNPSGLMRPPTIWAPSSTHRFPLRLGT
jgi:hypothetical protein